MGRAGRGGGEISARTAIHGHDSISTMGEHREVSNESNQSRADDGSGCCARLG